MASIIRGSDLFDTATAIGFSTNHNAATGTITIPSGLAIGTRRLIRKIHPTQGTVTINCSGETFTRANLASVELNADGDYWLLEKVSATRWELVDGWNTGENGNGQWVRKANGEMICTHRNSVTPVINAYTSYVWNYAGGSFIGRPVVVAVADSAVTAIQNVQVSDFAGNNTSVSVGLIRSTSVATELHSTATGRWYE